MNHWWYVSAAYAATLIGTVAIVGWSWAAMRRAERNAEAIGRERRAER